MKISRFCTTLRVYPETSKLDLPFKLCLFASKHSSERFFKDLLCCMKTKILMKTDVKKSLIKLSEESFRMAFIFSSTEPPVPSDRFLLLNVQECYLDASKELI